MQIRPSLFFPPVFWPSCEFERQAVGMKGREGARDFASVIWEGLWQDREKRRYRLVFLSFTHHIKYISSTKVVELESDPYVWIPQNYGIVYLKATILNSLTSFQHTYLCPHKFSWFHASEQIIGQNIARSVPLLMNNELLSMSQFISLGARCHCLTAEHLFKGKG